MPDSKIKFKCSISDLPTDLILQVQRIKMRSKWIKIKKFSFWLIKLKIVLCGIGGGIFWELNKKKNVVGCVNDLRDCICRTSGMEFYLLNYKMIT